MARIPNPPGENGALAGSVFERTDAIHARMTASAGAQSVGQER
jgi:hypothetical protein